VPVTEVPQTHRVALAVLMAVAVLVAFGTCDAVFAQGGPFGVARPPAPSAETGGFAGWILAKQGAFYRQLSALVRAAKADGTALWGLIGLSFLYGVFHAAGPGHGKAVISSYVVANAETWRRGVALSFASALLQALVAVAVVSVAAALLGATAAAMGKAVRVIEIGSYALIAALGARLIWSKGRALLLAVRPVRAPVAVGAAVTPHQHDGACCDGACGHAHGPDPEALAGPGGWRRGLSAIVAVGLRPCSGAVLVLVFALAQGLYWVGVAATLAMGVGTALTVAAIATLAITAKGLAVQFAARRPGLGILAVRGVEFAAAVLVFAFGVLLLTGYLASERLGLA